MSPREQIFADFVELNEFAADIGKHPRTIKRWQNEPDGFPIAKVGLTDYVHIPSARDWLMRKVRSRNPRRAAKSPAGIERELK
jgi:hypothetical protein